MRPEVEPGWPPRTHPPPFAGLLFSVQCRQDAGYGRHAAVSCNNERFDAGDFGSCHRPGGAQGGAARHKRRVSAAIIDFGCTALNHRPM